MYLFIRTTFRSQLTAEPVMRNGEPDFTFR